MKYCECVKEKEYEKIKNRKVDWADEDAVE